MTAKQSSAAPSTPHVVMLTGGPREPPVNKAVFQCYALIIVGVIVMGVIVVLGRHSMKALGAWAEIINQNHNSYS